MLLANCVPLHHELLNTTTGRGLPRNPLPPVRSQAHPAGTEWQIDCHRISINNLCYNRPYCSGTACMTHQ